MTAPVHPGVTAADLGGRPLAHVGSDADGAISLVLLVVVPLAFVVAEVVTRRRERARQGAADAGVDPEAGEDPPAPSGGGGPG